ncbi:MAG: HAMP domain-containing histidine kinase [Bdellovibrionales bacterium]|nr:HAMP domain-containing histidine kinase [Bdellovibrionales bacterium]
MLVFLFFSILLTGFTQFKNIASELNLIQLAFFPLSNRISSISSLYHLDSDFDFDDIQRNFQNRAFVNAIENLNPRIFNQSLSRAIADAKISLNQQNLDLLKLPINRLEKIIEQLIKHHDQYVVVIGDIVTELRQNNVKSAENKKDLLLEKKRNVKSHLNFLSTRVNDLTKRSIQEIVRNERKAVFIIAILSLITFIIAIVIGLVSILALRPLQNLKETAKEIAEGHLDMRVPIVSQDEVGDLSREFNKMAESIQERDFILRSQQKQLVESQKMAVIGQMASRISHEIRNPLNALSLNIELLEEAITDKKLKSLINAVSTEIDRLNRISIQYLDMARTPKGETIEIDVGKILTHLKVLFEPECQKQNISCEFDISDNLPRLKMNPTGLEQALINLCRNAIEVVGSDGHWGVNARRDDDQVIISVWDKGTGIPEENQQKIFEPFFTTKDKGTGLGLAITNEIIRELNGVLTCESKKEVGTTFTIRLPV